MCPRLQLLQQVRPADAEQDRCFFDVQHGSDLWGDSGMTSLTNVAEQLGYASHSAVSKRLARIRQQARAFFDDLE